MALPSTPQGTSATTKPAPLEQPFSNLSSHASLCWTGTPTGHLPGEISPAPPVSVQSYTTLSYPEFPEHSMLGPIPSTGHILPSLESSFRKYLLNDGYLSGSVPWTCSCSSLSQRHRLPTISFQTYSLSDQGYLWKPGWQWGGGLEQTSCHMCQSNPTFPEEQKIHT